jgi:uncharacterized DUF497 family protein
MKVVWDEPKRVANLRKHGMDLADAEAFDWNAARIDPVEHGRFQAIGWSNGRIISIVFAKRGTEGFSVISMRPASAKERRSYDEGSRLH